MRTVGLDLTQVITLIMACLVKGSGVLKKNFFLCSPYMHLEASCQVKYRTMQIAARRVSFNKFSCAHTSSIYFLLFALEKPVLAMQAMPQCITNTVTLKHSY